MSGKSFLGGIVVAVIYFLLGGFFYAWLMKDWFAGQSTINMTQPNMALIGLMCLAYGLLMAVTYPIGYRGGSAVKEGLRFGILFALIVNLPSGLSIVAMGSWTMLGFVVGLIWEIVVGAVLGIILAKMVGSVSKAAAPAM
jgi:hypothetical protein